LAHSYAGEGEVAQLTPGTLGETFRATWRGVVALLALFRHDPCSKMQLSSEPLYPESDKTLEQLAKL
jgi:hypothetical protein